jgi:hypothetical protein
VLGTLPALLLLACGAYLGLAFGNWFLFVGASLYLLITLAMIATDTPLLRPPAPPQDTPPNTLAPDAGDTDNEGKVPTRVPVAIFRRSGARPADGTLSEPPPP